MICQCLLPCNPFWPGLCLIWSKLLTGLKILINQSILSRLKNAKLIQEIFVNAIDHYRYLSFLQDTTYHNIVDASALLLSIYLLLERVYMLAWELSGLGFRSHLYHQIILCRKLKSTLFHLNDHHDDILHLLKG